MMTYVRVYKFDCCSRKNALEFLTNVLKDFMIKNFELLLTGINYIVMIKIIMNEV